MERFFRLGRSSSISPLPFDFSLKNKRSKSFTEGVKWNKNRAMSFQPWAHSGCVCRQAGGSRKLVNSRLGFLLIIRAEGNPSLLSCCTRLGHCTAERDNNFQKRFRTDSVNKKHCALELRVLTPYLYLTTCHSGYQEEELV